MQFVVKSILKTHIALHIPLKNHLGSAIENFCATLICAPALIICSKTDIIGTKLFGEEVARRWRQKGVDVTFKCFEDSDHVKHYQKYPEEYLKSVHDHWEKVKLLDRK